ncbi:hypothetical protein CWI42_010390 [Ordospora colligata]|uniref:Uncharacterized protein n=1 Tax=Ordospora colligata OC4 TaxID=1354746 RepID=A0A0B2UMU6_9MICR|nr:uncharacterized protein M896_010390 [Ordospora colligata OC4]KHN70387.1 hypothetical protein M896_010390 [Ordospora colligata OC4]TBU17137.1 hypothetical protein CWI41_010390 [Ordospora colligata]TBU17387.1 hypothetical protein CWI40_010390 [Ordospora colligata]TBU19567.1 hypothetical protein CWI42_010390 [Ordospora colligata]
MAEGFKSKYSDTNLFFDGRKNLYNAKDYINMRVKKENNAEEVFKKQFLSKEDKMVAFLIENRDLNNPEIKKVETSEYRLGRFVN